MHEQQVLVFASIPKCPLIGKVREIRSAVIFAVDGAGGQPVVKMDCRVGIDPWIRPSQGRFGQADGVHPRKSLRAEAGAVIVVRHADIAPIPRHMDVLHRVEMGDAVEWHMRLDRPPMLLRLEILDDLLDGTPVDLPPRKGSIERNRILGAEDQQAQDALHPGGPALGIGCDHDVVRTRREGAPAIAVDQPRAVTLVQYELPRPLAAANTAARMYWTSV